MWVDHGLGMGLFCQVGLFGVSINQVYFNFFWAMVSLEDHSHAVVAPPLFFLVQLVDVGLAQKVSHPEGRGFWKHFPFTKPGLFSYPVLRARAMLVFLAAAVAAVFLIDQSGSGDQSPRTLGLVMRQKERVLRAKWIAWVFEETEGAARNGWTLPFFRIFPNRSGFEGQK